MENYFMNRNILTKAHANMGISRGTGRNDNSTMKW